MPVLLLFIDGVGLGDSKDYNPFFRFHLPGLENLLHQNKLTKDLGYFENDGIWLIPTNATLGVEGVPQSATGQSTIFTGRNAPSFLGEHQSGFPFPRLREFIKKDNIYVQVKKLGKTATFANTYTEDFFERPLTKRGWLSTTTIAMLSADIPIRLLGELLRGEGVFHDITRETLRQKIKGIATVAPEEAAGHLLGLTKRFSLTVHEYFLTDVAGHRQDWELANNVLHTYDRFLQTIIEEKDEELTVILVSDHGNIEDMRTNNHTSNRVPTLIVGKNGKVAAEMISDLTDITPAILSVLKHE
ncbi:alkaline phosphatase family protein [Microaerobacter geothermalis]|uniref:alkaline phosphatase family protein n=1 Tax=Microaerobacter geothermalis TaxID=674972 RepID=UPI001F3BB99F|nr:alkaline phosphatase family protein [Microaerobacter geothermalis]MCF6092858.1 alkaline phosphatase family protein [Microaerobacter geothermalis]